MEKYDIETTDEFYAKTPDKQWVLVKLPVSKDEVKDQDNLSKEMKALLKKVSVKTTFGEYLGEPYEKIKGFEINKGKITQNEPLNSLALKAKNPLNSKENPFAYMGKTSFLEDDPTCSLCIGGDTDSCNSSIIIQLDGKKLTIEEAFNKCKLENFDIVLKLQNGQEIVPVKNHMTKTVDPNTLELIDRPIKYIMRHKVSKSKFRIKSETGKEIIVTGDHSCMVYRNNELISIKAKDINPETDKLVEIIKKHTKLSNIKSAEQLDDFQDEYVYDIEVEDTHTFFGNDILVHNSIYVEFGRIVNYCNITDPDKAARFVVDMWNYGIGPYMNKKYDEYAQKFNCDTNLENLELEKVADTAIMTAKKHYAMSECFLEPNIFVTPGEHVIYKGLELIQGSTPPFAKKCQDQFIRNIMNWYITHNNAPEFDDIYAMLKKFKDDFIKQNPEDICKSVQISDYDKFILDDKNNFVFGEHCPIHVKAAGIYNYILNQPKNKKYKLKYETVKTRDKVKFYKTTDPNYPVFGFTPGKYPLEFALPIDYNQQFEDLILTPLNRIIEILGYQPFTSDLCYVSSLF